MKILVTTKNKNNNPKSSLYVVPVWIQENGAVARTGSFYKRLSKEAQARVSEVVEAKGYTAGSVRELFDTSGTRYCVVGKTDWQKKDLLLATRTLVFFAKKEHLSRIIFSLDDYATKKYTPEEVSQTIVENIALADYDFSREFKTKPEKDWPRIAEVVLETETTSGEILKAVKTGEIVAEAINRCRTLSNYPPSLMTPEGLATAARDVGREVPALKVTVFDERKLKKEGMNAILAVGGGSDNPPRLITLEYKGAKKNKLSLALIGKGITFDSGGLNVKTPSVHMMDMHMDMSGGAAVISALYAIAKLKLPINVTGFVSAAENMISGRSYHQRDIITAYGGKTIEIGNTDAEGRVVLSDAIEYAKTKKPELVVTIATLTGAAVVALGERFAGLFVKENLKLRSSLEEIGETSGDYVWPLPLTKENEKDVEGTFADVVNTHKKDSFYGGASSGAAFLSVFAGTQPFAHIDMAPRMTANTDEEYLARGARGFGVAYFIELAKQWESIKKTLE